MKVCSSRLAVLAAVCWLLMAANIDRLHAADEPDRAPPPQASEPTVRELMEWRGVGNDVWEQFVEGELLDVQQVPLLRVLYAVDRLPPLDTLPPRAKQTLTALVDQPAEHRGDWLAITGKIERLTAIDLPEDLAERFELARYYRCEVRIEDPSSLVVVCTAHVPQAWQDGAPAGERVSCEGCFVALVPGEDESTQPLFVAPRLAWHAATVLGDLGMDAGLLDEVEDRGPLRRDEREAFYAMLAAARRAGTQELLRRTATQSTDVVPLFNRPADMRGQLVAVEGRVRRAVPIRIEDEALARRVGVDRYWEMEVFTDDSQGNPLVVCVTELPADMPRGDRINEPIRVPAFFFKSWAYHAPGAGEDKLQLAPLLIGREPRWLSAPPPATNRFAAVIAGICFILALAGVWFVLWRAGRGDERFRRQTLARRYEPAGPIDVEPDEIEPQPAPRVAEEP